MALGHHADSPVRLASEGRVMFELWLLLASFGFILLVLSAAADQRWGPDTDLDGPWEPGDRPWWRP